MCHHNLSCGKELKLVATKPGGIILSTIKNFLKDQTRLAQYTNFLAKCHRVSDSAGIWLGLMPFLIENATPSAAVVDSGRLKESINWWNSPPRDAAVMALVWIRLARIKLAQGSGEAFQQLILARIIGQNFHVQEVYLKVTSTRYNHQFESFPRCARLGFVGLWGVWICTSCPKYLGVGVECIYFCYAFPAEKPFFVCQKEPKHAHVTRDSWTDTCSLWYAYIILHAGETQSMALQFACAQIIACLCSCQMCWPMCGFHAVFVQEMHRLQYYPNDLGVGSTGCSGTYF